MPAQPTSRKCQHTTECQEICPQNVLQTLGSGLFATTPCGCLTSLNCLNADSTLISAPCSKLCTDYLISPLAFLILTQAELKVLTNSFCFIDPLPALANYTCTSITRCPSYSCLFSSTTIYCRYLHHRTPSKMFTFHHAERNCKECVTLRKGVQGSNFCYIM